MSSWPPTEAEPLASRVEPDPALTPTALDRMVFERGFPITAEGVTTFAYRGEADEVHLSHFGFGLPEDLSFTRLANSTWWLLALSVPEGTRLEYKLNIREGDNRYDTADPLNPFEARNPFGHNSVCRSHGYTVPPWAQRDPEAEEGLQRSLTVPSAHLSRKVHVTLYLPASFSMEPEHRYPLLILHDGTDYLHYADAAVVLDNLIHRGLTPEFVVAFCDPGDRLHEYANNENHARFVAEELVPYLEGHLPLLGGRDNRCLGGASFGAVATLSTAVRYPDTFGRLLLQSGSFDGASPDCPSRPDELWRPVKEFVTGYVNDPIKVADRIYMSCGLFEPLICENRVMREILVNGSNRNHPDDDGSDHVDPDGSDAEDGATNPGVKVLMGEALDSHTWGCWRDHLGVGLPWLFADSFRQRDVRPFEKQPPPSTENGADRA